MQRLASNRKFEEPIIRKDELNAINSYLHLDQKDKCQQQNPATRSSNIASSSTAPSQAAWSGG
ncbi:MAG: hypothetical protein KJP25_11310 [Gammaproteobacteria bacterium]|nr:hypothetical protein [Gammaproteobacteria bacterium]MBT8151173.1 hypothetical protein [Gammaproteobacteria bacterium]NND39371.1 hypothetical protein [Pseudomonadales bacterium]